MRNVPPTVLLSLVAFLLAAGCQKHIVSTKPGLGFTNHRPIAVLSADSTNGNAPFVVNFDASASYDPDTGDTVVRYMWDLDEDGLEDSSTTTGFLQQIFGEPKKYRVRVRVTDRLGLLSMWAEVTITVLPPKKPPVAMATANKYVGDAPLTVAFSAEGSSDADGNIDLYQWDYSSNGTWDESNSTGMGQYTYTVAGYYQATLLVRDNDGLSATDTITLAVGVSPWVSEGIDVVSPQSWGPSLAFDPEGNVLTAYLRSPPSGSTELILAKRVGTSWEKEILYQDRISARSDISLALSPEGSVYIGLTSGSFQVNTVDIKTMTRNGDSWYTDTAFTEGFWLMQSIDGLRLAVSGNGFVAILYRVIDETGWPLYLAGLRKQYGVWKERDIHSGSTGTSGSLGYGPDGNLVTAYGSVRYVDIPDGRLKAETFIRLDTSDGTWWTHKDIDLSTAYQDEPIMAREAPSIAFDPDGRVWLAYIVGVFGLPPYSLKLAFNNGSSWQFESLGTTSSAPFLSLDQEGNPAIAHLRFDPQTGNSELVYAWKRGSEWHEEVVDSLREPAWELDFLLISAPHLEFDRKGRPTIVYYDGKNPELKLASRIAKP